MYCTILCTVYCNSSSSSSSSSSSTEYGVVHTRKESANWVYGAKQIKHRTKIAVLKAHEGLDEWRLG